MAIGGAGQLFGVAINAKALDRLGLKKVIYLNLLFLCIWFSVIMVYDYYYTFSLWFAGLMTFTYGKWNAG